MRLEVGDRVRTNYDKKIYQIISIQRGCVCPSFLSALNLKNPPQSPEHVHLAVKEVQADGSMDRERVLLNGFDEVTLANVWNDDMLTLCPNIRRIQRTLF